MDRKKRCRFLYEDQANHLSPFLLNIALTLYYTGSPQQAPGNEVGCLETVFGIQQGGPGVPDSAVQYPLPGRQARSGTMLRDIQAHDRQVQDGSQSPQDSPSGGHDPGQPFPEEIEDVYNIPASLVALRDILGHRDIKMTVDYIEPRLSSQRQIIRKFRKVGNIVFMPDRSQPGRATVFPCCPRASHAWGAAAPVDNKGKPCRATRQYRRPARENPGGESGFRIGPLSDIPGHPARVNCQPGRSAARAFQYSASGFHGAALRPLADSLPQCDPAGTDCPCACRNVGVRLPV